MEDVFYLPNDIVIISNGDFDLNDFYNKNKNSMKEDLITI